MKFLKPFNENNNYNSFYSEITQFDYSKSNRSYKPVLFSDQEVNRINNLVSGYDVIINIVSNIVYIVYKNISISISKKEDEWYYINYQYNKPFTIKSYFKCDQFESVVKFICNKMSINENLLLESTDVKLYTNMGSKFFNFTFVDMNENEKNIIRELSSDNFDFEIGISNLCQFIKLENKRKRNPGINNVNFGLPRYLRIFKIEDEWFICAIKPMGLKPGSDIFYKYKCDQLEGLLQLLKDKKVIK